MPVWRSRLRLLLFASLTALVLLGAADRVVSDAGSGGRALDAQLVLGVESGALVQPSVVVDTNWSVAERVAKYRDVIVAIVSGLFMLAVVASSRLVVRASAGSPARSWRSERRGRAPTSASSLGNLNPRSC